MASNGAQVDLGDDHAASGSVLRQGDRHVRQVRARSRRCPDSADLCARWTNSSLRERSIPLSIRSVSSGDVPDAFAPRRVEVAHLADELSRSMRRRKFWFRSASPAAPLSTVGAATPAELSQDLLHQLLDRGGRGRRAVLLDPGDGRPAVPVGEVQLREPDRDDRRRDESDDDRGVLPDQASVRARGRIHSGAPGAVSRATDRPRRPG